MTQTRVSVSNKQEDETNSKHWRKDEKRPIKDTGIKKRPG
jgi:hypothetical protein